MNELPLRESLKLILDSRKVSWHQELDLSLTIVISGFFLYIDGMTFIFMSYLSEYTEDFGYFWIIGNIIAFVFCYCLPYFLLFQPACLTIEILLCEFSFRCKGSENLDFKNALQIIRLYENIDKSFGIFLFFYIAATQLFIIFYTFLSYSTLFMKANSDWTDLLIFFGLHFVSLSYFFTLMGIIFACDDAFKQLKNLKKIIEKEVWQTRELGRLADLKYTLRLLDEIEPLSACGYFSVTKRTITSMVSVRY